MKRTNRRAVYRSVWIGGTDRTYRIFQYFRFGASQPVTVAQGINKRWQVFVAGFVDHNRGRDWDRKCR